MIEINKKDFIAEYAQLIKSKEYKELLEYIKEEETKKRKLVFEMYTDIKSGHLEENQILNEKNAIVEVMSISFDIKDRFEKLNLPGTKYIIAEIDDRIKNGTSIIEKSVGGLSNGITMSVYTPTDIILRGANALQDMYEYYDKEIEKYKKDTEDDDTLSEVEED